MPQSPTSIPNVVNHKEAIELLEKAFPYLAITDKNQTLVYCSPSVLKFFQEEDKKNIGFKKNQLDTQNLELFSSSNPENKIHFNFFSSNTKQDKFYVSSSVDINNHFNNIPFKNNFSNQNQDRIIKKQLITVIQNMPSGILMENAERKIALVNPEFLKIFSIPLSVTDLIGMDCKIYAEEFKSIFKEENNFVDRINQILKNGKDVRAEHLRTVDGRTISRDFSPILLNGKLEGYLWNYSDVTDTVKKDEFIRINEEKYRRVLENLDLGIIEVDFNNNITKAYPGFCKLTGYKPEELLGKSALETLVEKEDWELVIGQTKRRSKGETDVYELKIKRKDGDFIWVLISGAPIYDVNNKIIGSIGIHWDNTETKLREEELRKAKESAEISSKAKKQFLANISHEIRTPINVIKGMADILNESELNSEQKQELQAIRISSKNLLEIVNDLLNFSKIEAGKIDLKAYEFSPSEIISEALELFLPQIKEKGIELKYIIDAKIPNLIIGDELKLKQILNNLISNAIKFTDKGGIFVTVELKRDYQEECIIQLSVIDTGIGIKKEKQEIIFEYFTQADYDTTRKYGGTGLGLSITKELVEVMGGNIQLISNEGAGSRFIVNLPFQKSVNPEKIIEQTQPVKEFNTYPDKKIILAEDSKLNKHLVLKVLEKLKCQVDCVENGLDLIQYIDKNKYDLILMDIHMPEMDGYTATNIIRTQLKKEIPIIALTANAAKEDADKAIQAGMNDYLSKPFEKNQLLEKIEFFFNESHEKKRNIINGNLKFINLDYLNQISNGDPSFVKKILNLFIQQNKTKLLELDLALKENKSDDIRKISHTLKSGAKTLGIENLSSKFEEIEKQFSNPNPQIDMQKIENKINLIKNLLLNCEKEINLILNKEI